MYVTLHPQLTYVKYVASFARAFRKAVGEAPGAYRKRSQSAADRYGNVILFDRLEISNATKAQSDAIWVLIGRFVKRELPPRRRACIMLLKAFPLEYRGKVTAENAAAFARRQNALMRLFERRLSMQALMGGENGWMWRNFNYPTPPRKRRSRPEGSKYELQNQTARRLSR